MKHLKNIPLFIALFLMAITLWAPSADAQLVVVNGKYRIVEVDHAENRIGVALPDADPDVEQTWVYIKADTRASIRHYYGNGLFKDEVVGRDGLMELAETHEGELVKVHGGRDWDGSIDAKAIWF